MVLGVDAGIPPMSFESIVTTSTNFIVGAGQKIEMSGKVTHIPKPESSRSEIRNMMIGNGVDDCPACQRMQASHLQSLEASRQALRIKAVNGWEGLHTDVSTLRDTVTLVNESDFPIYNIVLIGARLEAPGAFVVSHPYWPPENRLEGDHLQVTVLQPGESHIFRGRWKWREDFVLAGNIVLERRVTYVWADNHGQIWQRDGNESPKYLSRSSAWTNIWGNIKYVDQPNVRPEAEDSSKSSQ
jgi:hypothetical protein